MNKDKYLLADGDVVISRAGSVGFSALISNPQYAVFASYLIRFRPHINKKYFHYFLQSPLYWKSISENKLGIAIPNVNASKLRNIPIPVPSFPEQERIVARIEELFSQLDAGTAALNRAHKKLKQYMTRVLKDSFDLSLVIDHYRLQYDSVNRYMKQLGKIALVTIGGTPSRNILDYWNGDINWVSSGEVRNNYIHNTKEQISDLGLRNSNAKIYPVGTVLLAMIGEGKTRGQVGILTTPASTNQNVAAILPNTDEVVSEWIFYWFMSRYEETRRNSSGGMQFALNSSRIREFEIPIPPLDVQTEIVKKIDQIYSIIGELSKNVSVTLARESRLRESILRLAFEGKLL